jgi:hypothetical protein
MYKIKVLLADDYESIQRMLSAFLKANFHLMLLHQLHKELQRL